MPWSVCVGRSFLRVATQQHCMAARCQDAGRGVSGTLLELESLQECEINQLGGGWMHAPLKRWGGHVCLRLCQHCRLSARRPCSARGQWRPGCRVQPHRIMATTGLPSCRAKPPIQGKSPCRWAHQWLEGLCTWHCCWQGELWRRQGMQWGG
jgi:hypothetical protein